MTNLLVASFPKSGRTWLRVMLDDLGIPAQYKHLGASHFNRKHFAQIDVRVPPEFDVVVGLVRNPIDTVVSGFHQCTSRLGNFRGGMLEFVQSPHHGIEKIARFNLALVDECRRVPRSVVISYEDMHADAAAVLMTVAQLVADPVTEVEALETADRYKFAYMQEAEVRGILGERYGDKLRVLQPDNPNSAKVRRGVVGGYVDEMTAEEIGVCNEVLLRLDYEQRMASVVERIA